MVLLLHMNNKPNRPLSFYTCDDALDAKTKGKLNEWVQDFLHTEGNHGLAKALQTETPIEIDMIDFPLELLNRIKGPEPEEHREQLHVWDDRVSTIQSKIKDGHAFPPLIVTDYWNPFEIVDGNHRHEALLKNGIKRHWTIFFIKHQESKKYLEDILKQYDH